MEGPVFGIAATCPKMAYKTVVLRSSRFTLQLTLIVKLTNGAQNFPNQKKKTQTNKLTQTTRQTLDGQNCPQGMLVVSPHQLHRDLGRTTVVR